MTLVRNTVRWSTVSKRTRKMTGMFIRLTGRSPLPSNLNRLNGCSKLDTVAIAPIQYN